MYHHQGFLVLFLLFTLNSAQGQKYILDPRYHLQQSHDEFYNSQQGSSFPLVDTYSHRDLQTSDLPFHLQKTLPQYRFSHNNANIIFGPHNENVVPSTHRPNYSQFLLQNNNRRIPSQQEYFLRNIGFKDNEQFKPSTSAPIPDKLLREHTRILAPDTLHLQARLEENKYFVNPNGEVFSTPPPPPTIFSSKKLRAKLLVEEDNSESSKNNDVIGTDQVVNSANNFDSTDYEYDDQEIKAMLNFKRQKGSRELVDDDIDKPVVSVVTTKSVINNTVIPVTTPSPTGTTPVNSTDAWVVVASVQTSKSVSGAHYLPSSVVAQEERVTMLYDKNRMQKLNEDTTLFYEDYDQETTSVDESTSPTVTVKHSTESLIDKLDRVQSDLSSGLLTGGYKNENNIAVITENMTEKVHMNEMTEPTTKILQPTKKTNLYPVIKKFSPGSRPPYSKRKQPNKRPESSISTAPAVPQSTITSFKQNNLLPTGYKLSKDNSNNSELLTELLTKFKESLKTDANKENASSDHRFGLHTSNNVTEKLTSNSSRINDALLKLTKPVENRKKLPQESKFIGRNETQLNNSSEAWNKRDGIGAKTSTVKPISIDAILQKSKQEDLTAFLPPGYKLTTPKTSTSKPVSIDAILQKSKQEDISAFLPPGYKVTTAKTTTNKSTVVDALLKKSKQEDISSLLPPGYKSTTTENTVKYEKLLEKSKKDDLSGLLPPGFKTQKPKIEDILENSAKDDISAFLPPGYKSRSSTTRKATTLKETNIEVEDLPTSLLPSGYKQRKDAGNKVESTTAAGIVVTTSTSTEKPSGGLKVVFPSRPGRKRTTHGTTKTPNEKERKEVTRAPAPTIHKGWPSRATTEFTGWPTPSTTPISIEKLLESVHQRSENVTKQNDDSIITISSSNTTPITTTTTTTQKPTTPGVCVDECDLVGTIKLVKGVKWVPELLDRNTKEWQLLANEVQTQLETIYTSSDRLNKLFKNLRIDGFSEGSVLVDYLVEIINPEMRISTSELKQLFNEALDLTKTNESSTYREGKSINETDNQQVKVKLGKFFIDPHYTDFIVIPRQLAPRVGYAEDNLLLPQWAIAVIVIGLASLLFVIIFGITVLVNRSKNAKKKLPMPLTDDMLNELNKNHMNGYDNYGAEDLHTIEAGFWDPRRMDAHRFHKKGSSSSIHDNSMTNLYDSWKSQWNGPGINPSYSSNSANSHRLHERRRSYDTNF